MTGITKFAKRKISVSGRNYFGVILILISLFGVASTVYYPKSSSSEGTWEKDMQSLRPQSKISQGASRLDVTGVLTPFGMRQGASMFALIIFPLLFPFIIVAGLGMLLFSMLGTNGLAVVGRRSGLIENSLGGDNPFPGWHDGVLPGYKLDGDGFLPTSLTNREGFALDAVENDTCLERFACELLLRGGAKLIGRKITIAGGCDNRIAKTEDVKMTKLVSLSAISQDPAGTQRETHFSAQCIPGEEIEKSLEVFGIPVLLGEVGSLDGEFSADWGKLINSDGGLPHYDEIVRQKAFLGYAIQDKSNVT